MQKPERRPAHRVTIYLLSGAKIESARSGFRLLVSALLVGLGLLAGCKSGQKVNQWSDGKYYSAREMAALKKQERQRHREAVKEEKARAAHQRDYEKNQAQARTRPKPARPARPTTPPPNRSANPLPLDQQTRELIRIARTYVGTPYVGGGTTRMGMDCSGLLCTTFQEAGLDLPRTSGEQSIYGTDVNQNELRPGDLVFFATDGGGSRRISHVGMVTDVRQAQQDVAFIHASSSLGVKEDNLFVNYWRKAYIKAVRPRYVARSVASDLLSAPAQRQSLWQVLFGR